MSEKSMLKYKFEELQTYNDVELILTIMLMIHLTFIE